MSEKYSALDIRRSYEFTLERQSDNLEIPFCKTHTYTFQTDEGYRYVLLVDEFEDIYLLGLKFYRANDYESQHKYNVLTVHKNPFRFFSTILCIIKEVVTNFPKHSIILKGEPTIKEIEEGVKHNKNIDDNTKRFKFYKRLLAEMVNSGSYSFEENKEKSILLLLNSSTTEQEFAQIEDFLYSSGFNL
jgi:hypothetical protein